MVAHAQPIPAALYRDEGASPDEARDELTEMLAFCCDGWLEAVDTALARGATEQVAIKATRLWLAGDYERADLLLQMGQDVHYTVVTDRGSLEKVMTSLLGADVIAIDTETYPPEEVRADVERAESHLAQLTAELEQVKATRKGAKTEAQKQTLRTVCDAIEDQLKAAKAKLKAAKQSLKRAGLDPHQAKIRLLQLAVENRPVVMIDLKAFDDAPDSESLQRVLMSDAVKVFHNANFDLQMLWSIGLDVGGQIFDTMLAARLLDPRDSAALDAVARRYLNKDISKAEQMSDWSDELTDSQWFYAAADAMVLLPLRERLKSELVHANLTRIARIEFDCVRATAEMEYVGMKIDAVKIDAYRRHVEGRMAELETALYGYLGEISLTSPQQLKAALRQIGIDVGSTARSALIPLIEVHPCIPLLLEFKKLSTLVSAFLNPLPRATSAKTGRVHANYWQLGARTGRFSCSNPNFQQVPRDGGVRSCFVTEEGNKLVVADYSQIELRVAAAISGDRRMIDAYCNGEDLHTLTASLVQGISPDEVTKEQREAAKAVNFGLIYGMGAKGVKYIAKRHYGVEMTLEEAYTFRKRYFEAYSGIQAWHRTSVRALKHTNEQKTLCGRRCVWGETPPWFTAFINTQVQGTAADIAKLALGRLARALKGTGAKIIAMIHDEIILEAPEANAVEVARILQETMESAGGEVLKNVPVVAEARIADSWAEK